MNQVVDFGSKRRIWLSYAFACLACWGIWAFLAKITTTEVGAAETQFLFTLGMVPFALVFAIRSGLGSLVSDRIGVGYGIINGLLTGVGTILMFSAFRNGPASVITPVSGAYPLVTVLLAMVILGERLNYIQYIGLAAALVGLTLIAM